MLRYLHRRRRSRQIVRAFRSMSAASEGFGLRVVVELPVLVRGQQQERLVLDDFADGRRVTQGLLDAAPGRRLREFYDRVRAPTSTQLSGAGRCRGVVSPGCARRLDRAGQ
jgi:hypothetical protein